MWQELCDRTEIQFKALMPRISPLPGFFLLGTAGVLHTTPASPRLSLIWLFLTEYCVLLLKASQAWSLWKLIPPGGWQWQLCWFLLALLGSVAKGWKWGVTDLKRGHVPVIYMLGARGKGLHSVFPLRGASYSPLSFCPLCWDMRGSFLLLVLTEMWWTRQLQTGFSLTAESL